MWRETVLIIPQLEPGGAQKLEQGLNGRFSNISKKFGLTLRNFMRGAFLGVGLAFLNKLLSPIDSLEERMRDLFNQSRDIADLASRFGSTPGELKRTQDVAKSFGLQPDQFKEMINKYAEAVFTARRELADPFKEKSDSTIAVKQFANDQDIVKSFKEFLGGLSGVEKTKGVDARRRVEEAIFGNDLYGGAKRFAESDMEARARKLALPSDAVGTRAILKGAALESATQTMAAKRDAGAFVSDIGALDSKKVLAAIASQQQTAAERQTKQLESFQDLKQAAASLETIKNTVEDFNVSFLKGLGQWPQLFKEIGEELKRQNSLPGARSRERFTP